MLGAGQDFKSKYLSGARDTTACVCAPLAHVLLLPGTALQYYFTVNTRYVRNKLKVLIFPFTLRGHWNRTLEQARN